MILRRDAMPLPALVDLVNGWGTVPRRVAEEDDRPFPAAVELLARLDLPESVTSETSDTQLRQLADTLYPAFSSDDVGERARIVTDLLARSGVAPALADIDGQVESVWTVARDTDAVCAAAATALRDQLVEHSPDRFGTCAAARCADVFVDSSPAGHRRYCSLTCQNRARVAAFRERRKNPPRAAHR